MNHEDKALILIAITGILMKYLSESDCTLGSDLILNFLEKTCW